QAAPEGAAGEPVERAAGANALAVAADLRNGSIPAFHPHSQLHHVGGAGRAVGRLVGPVPRSVAEDRNPFHAVLHRLAGVVADANAEPPPPRPASRGSAPAGRGKISAMKDMLRSMLTMRPQPRSRAVFAARSGLCMGVPVLVGWLAGDLQAGMMAATGGFTALYGRGRPYRSRAVELALIALAFALVVAIGNAVSGLAWVVVPTVAVVAMLSTWLGNALRIGPPGAFMFMMACAAATAMPARHINPAESFVLVLAGGGFAWVAHMAGVLVRPRGPEERAVGAASRAVCDYIQAIGGPREASARQVAAQALNDALHALVGFQPADALVRARQLGRLDSEPPQVEAGPVLAEAPLGHPSARALLRESLRWRSMSTLVVVRVGIAAVA